MMTARKNIFRAHKAFQRQKENDRQKNSLCKKLGIQLIRIPYTHMNDIGVALLVETAQW